MKNLFLFLGLMFFNLISNFPSVSSISMAQSEYNPSSNVRDLGHKGPNVEDVAELISIPVRNLSSVYSYVSVNKIGYSLPSVSQVIKEANNPNLSKTSLKNSNKGGILKGKDLSYEREIEDKERLARNSLEGYHKAVYEKLHPENQIVKSKEPYHRVLPIVSALPGSTNYTQKKQDLNQHEREHKSEHEDERNYSNCKTKCHNL